MDDLAAFISARLDEDEAAHRHAGQGRIAWLTYNREDGQLSHTTVAADHHDGEWCADGKLLPEPASVLIVYDQQRALREITAKRAMVDAATNVPDDDDPYYGGYDTAMEFALRHLAAVWSDHPGYQQEWAT